MPTIHSRIRGCLLGGALGDALGNPIEFLSLADIRARYGPAGLLDPLPDGTGKAPFTDDTQMTLFVAEGLLRAHSARLAGISEDSREFGRRSLLRWYATQTGIPRGQEQDPLYSGWLLTHKGLFRREAPGNTCLSALSNGGHGTTENRINTSKGCGTVMRLAPPGLFLPLPKEEVFAYAVANGAITHGHPSGFLAGGHFALAIRGLVEGLPLKEAIGQATQELRLWQPGHEAEETITIVAKALDLAGQGSPSPEKVERLGGGWVAEEALAIAYYCALSYPEDFKAAVRLSVNHSGDGDSTGAVCGNLLGAMLGEEALPGPWLPVLDQATLVAEVADDLYAAGATGTVSGEKYPATW